jgi:hypothetical protein
LGNGDGDTIVPGTEASGVHAAELFDPVANTISPTANLSAARSVHTVTLLSTGQVLVTGGLDANSNALATAELYH